jgi:hypothetical protein
MPSATRITAPVRTGQDRLFGARTAEYASPARTSRQTTLRIPTFRLRGSGGGARSTKLAEDGFLRKFFHVNMGSSGETVYGRPPASSVATVGTSRMRSPNNSHSMLTSCGSPVMGYAKITPSVAERIGRSSGGSTTPVMRKDRRTK